MYRCVHPLDPLRYIKELIRGPKNDNNSSKAIKLTWFSLHYCFKKCWKIVDMKTIGKTVVIE
jgi:hypothetical protein